MCICKPFKIILVLVFVCYISFPLLATSSSAKISSSLSSILLLCSGTSIAIGKSVRMINTLHYNYYDWNAEFVVDGNLTNYDDKCHCCAATQYSKCPWFEVDLGRRYRISYINVYGRNKPADRRKLV